MNSSNSLDMPGHQTDILAQFWYFALPWSCGPSCNCPSISCCKNSSITILLPQRNRLLYTESSLHMDQKDFSLSLIFCFSGQSSLLHCLTCSKYFLQVVWCCKSAFNQLGVAEKCDTTVEMNSSDDLYNSSDSLSLISVGDGDL